MLLQDMATFRQLAQLLNFFFGTIFYFSIFIHKLYFLLLGDNFNIHKQTQQNECAGDRTRTGDLCRDRESL